MLIARTINTVFRIFELLLFAYVLLSWLRISENKWTTLLRRIMEPVMNPVRNFLRSKLPAQFQVLDFTPVVVYILAEILRGILVGLFIY